MGSLVGATVWVLVAVSVSVFDRIQTVSTHATAVEAFREAGQCESARNALQNNGLFEGKQKLYYFCLNATAK